MKAIENLEKIIKCVPSFLHTLFLQPINQEASGGQFFPLFVQASQKSSRDLRPLTQTISPRYPQSPSKTRQIPPLLLGPPQFTQQTSPKHYTLGCPTPHPLTISSKLLLRNSASGVPLAALAGSNILRLHF